MSFLKQPELVTFPFEKKSKPHKILKDFPLHDLGSTKPLGFSSEMLLDTIIMESSIKHRMKGTENLL